MKILKNTAIAFLFFGAAFAMGYFIKTNAKSLIDYDTKTQITQDNLFLRKKFTEFKKFVLIRLFEQGGFIKHILIL